MIITPVGTTTIRMARGAMCIDNASDTTSTALSRIFRLIKAVNLRGIKYQSPHQVPLYSIDPQTQDRIYDKTNTNSTIRYVNAQITQEKRMNDFYDW
jgi:hypothetical protein